MKFKKELVAGCIAAMTAISALNASAAFFEDDPDGSSHIISVTQGNGRFSIYICDEDHYDEAEQSYGQVTLKEECYPFIDENGRTQVPLRTIAEDLNFEVTWDGQTQAITMVKGENKINLRIGDNRMTVNTTSVEMDTQPIIINDYTYIPLRFIGEAFGYEVEYNEMAIVD